MLNSLRFRLFLSYLFVVAASLLVIGLALLLFVRLNPNLQRLEESAYLNQTVRTLTRQDQPPTPASLEELNNYARRIAAAYNVRVAFVTPAGQVIVDSDVLEGNVEPGDLGPVTISGRGIARGTLRDGSQQVWLYVASANNFTPKARLLLLTPRVGPILFLIENFLTPLLQAACVGAGLAALMALLVTYWLTTSLRKFSAAARAVAQGDFGQKAPESGPAEIKSLAQSFNEMIERTRASQQVQRDFVANVSHELKTPLTSIQGFSQAILDGATDDPAHAARIINEEAGRVRRLVDGLLDLARLDAGQAALQRGPTELTAILHLRIENLGLRAAEKNVTLQADIPPLPTIVADGDRLAQVFTNLLDNALKHTPNGGTIALTAKLDPGQNAVTVTIADTGAGIPPEDLSRIFERFYRVDKSRAAGQGYGIGLAITKEIIQAHGGKIKAESRPGQGAKFIVQLPVIRGDDSTVARRRNVPR